jgi:hypothetical protein
MKTFLSILFSIRYIRFYELLSIICLSIFANKISSENIVICLGCKPDVHFIIHYGSFLIASVFLFNIYTMLDSMKNLSEKRHLNNPQKTTIIGIYKNLLVNKRYKIVSLWVIILLSIFIYIAY